MSITAILSAQSVSTRTYLNIQQRPWAYSDPWERLLM